MERPYRDAEWLREKYHGEGMTQREIAEECGAAPRTIRRWMKRHDSETREIAGEHHGLHGQKRSEETKRKISESLEGRSFTEETLRKMAVSRTDNKLSEETKRKISESLSGKRKSEETREKMSRSTARERNPNWQGGHYSKWWYGPEWEGIRESIVERDEVCQECGVSSDGMRLEVHHIIPLRRFVESANVPEKLAHHEENLILLCKRCHGRTEQGVIELDVDFSERFVDTIRPLLDTN